MLSDNASWRSSKMHASLVYFNLKLNYTNANESALPVVHHPLTHGREAHHMMRMGLSANSLSEFGMPVTEQNGFILHGLCQDEER